MLQTVSENSPKASEVIRPPLLPILAGGRHGKADSGHEWRSVDAICGRDPSRANLDVAAEVVHMASSESPTVSSLKPLRFSTFESMRGFGSSATMRHGNSRVMTNSQVMEVRVRELTGIIPSEVPGGHNSEDDELFDSHRRFCLERVLYASFRLCGVLSYEKASMPWLVVVYKSFVVLLLLTIFAFTTVQVALFSSGVCDKLTPRPQTLCPESYRLLTEVLVFAAAVALIALLGSFQGVHRLDDLLCMLRSYAAQHDLLHMWHTCAVQDVAVMFVIMLAAVVSHICGRVNQGGEMSAWAVAHETAHSLVVAILMLGLIFLLYVLRILIVTVDVFCYQSVSNPNILEATQSWNILQALLRKASTAMELGLLALLAMAAFAVPAFIVDQANLGTFSNTFNRQIPNVLIICGVLRVFVVAAAVTDKCMRVPSLVNSLSFGAGTDRDRQHLVEYIAHSAAGFYICDVRLTLGMLTKFIYVWAVILFGFVGRELTGN